MLGGIVLSLLACSASAGPTEACRGVTPTGDPAEIPYTVRPEIQNAALITRELQRAYPEALRRTGVSRTVHVWLLVSTKGRVDVAQVREPSGETSLDQAAVKVAKRMRFSPGTYRDCALPMWVRFPLLFSIR